MGARYSAGLNFRLNFVSNNSRMFTRQVSLHRQRDLINNFTKRVPTFCMGRPTNILRGHCGSGIKSLIFYLFFFKVEAVVIQEISFRKPKREHFHLQLQDFVVDQQPVHFADTASFLEKLKKANKSAVIFSVTDPKPQPKL